MLLVEQIRRERGLTQSKLARLSDINQTSLSRIENGLEPAYPNRGRRIAEALGWKGDPSELFEEVPENEYISS